jgi:hypothetical protein
LQGITIPPNVTEIGTNAFSACYGLSNITIGIGVTNIADSAFAYTPLTNVTLDANLSSIGPNGFLRTALGSIFIPSNVTQIGAVALFSPLTNIFVDSGNPAYASWGGVLFNKSGSTLIQYPPARTGGYSTPAFLRTIATAAFDDCALTSVTLTSGLGDIGNSAFFACTTLTNVIVPATVTNIEDYAFGYCLKLAGIYYQGNAPALGANVFQGYLGPLPTVNYYLPGTVGWGTTYGSQTTAPWLLPYPLILTQGPTLGVGEGGFGFLVSWATNASVVLQVCTNFSNPTWASIQTNSLTNGSTYFADASWNKSAAGIYRIWHPPSVQVSVSPSPLTVLK